jgi:predicted SnoaL-like aldol condensation-catalyzing enzyme
MKRKNFIVTTSIVLGTMLIVTSCNNQSKEIESLKTRLDSVTNQLALKEAADQQLVANKILVSDMYQELFGDKDINAADKYIVENYIQHNPYAKDGREALKTVLKDWFKGAQKDKIDIRHLAADGDYVYIHTRSKMGDKTYSVIDIFRIENNKVVEHWDVIQEVPAKAANAHPMF